MKFCLKRVELKQQFGASESEWLHLDDLSNDLFTEKNLKAHFNVIVPPTTR